MATNPFDQFDAPQANPFDQFDAAPTFGGMLQDELLRPFRAARDVVAGGVRGAGSIGASLIRPFESGEENTARRIAMDAALKSMGADPESYAYGGGKLATEVAGTAGLGGFLARPLAAAAQYAPAVINPIVNALRSSGFSSGMLPTAVAGVAPQAIPLATRAADIGARVVGGGATGGATLALTNPDEIGTGVGLGAGVAMLGPSVGKSIEYLAPKVARALGGAKDIFMPSGLKTTGLAAALNNDPALMAQVKTLLEQGKTIEQAAAITGSTGLATFAKTSRNASPATQMLYNDLDAALEATQANQLAAATQNVNALAQANLPVATASPTAPRRAVKQTLAGEAATLQGRQAAMTGQLTAEQQAAESALQGRQTAMTGQLTAEQQAAEAALAAQRQGVEGGIANVSQLETGQALAKATSAIEDVTKKTVTGPAYNKAFELAPDPTIQLDSLASVAKGQLGEVLTQIKGLAPNASVVLERYGPKQVEIMVNGVPVKTMQPANPVTLAEADAIRKAINIDYASLKGSQESGANIARARLVELKTALDEAIRQGAPKEAAEAYRVANELFKNRIVDVFRTGQPANLGRTSTLNQPMLLPGDIVSKTMADEGSALQFLKVFQQDPAAMQKLKMGVEDLYRQQVLAGGKAATPEKHAAFMFTNERQLAALDNAGLGMSTRLNQIGDQVKGLTAAETALTGQREAIPSKVTETFKSEVEKLIAQGKSIPSKVAEAFKAEDEALNLASKTLGFGQTDKLRSAIVSSPEVAGQALIRMDAPAKSSLARGVMQDAGKASDPLKHLVDNEQGIMRVLRANDPKTAKATFDTAKNVAEITKLIEETSSKLGVKPQPNAMVTQQNLNRMTQGLPQVRAVVEDIQAQLAQGKTFEELAAQGAKSQTSALKLFREQTTPHMFPLNKVWSIANAVLGKLEGRIDAKLAVEIANELSTSATAAAAVGKAQARQAKQLEINEVSRGAANLVRKIPPSAAVNFLAPSQQNQNAMTQQ
jgi:hypothetical protein